MNAPVSLNPRHWVIFWLTPFLWRLFPERKLNALQEFAAVERDSGGQLMDCIPLVRENKLKAHLFQHVMEEIYHGEIFEALCKSLSHKQLAYPSKHSEFLVKGGEGELPSILSYVHVGESAVNRDFLCFARASREPSLRAVFLRAGGDEGKHEGDTGDILFELSGRDRWRYARLILEARLKRAWTLYTSSMRAIGSVVLTALLSLAYLPFGALAVVPVRRRFRMGATEQVAVLAEQVQEFERRMR